jgi:hypothetical protein
MTAIWDEDSAFYSASSRLARGYEHISQMERQIREYFAEKPYDLVRDLDPADRTYQRLKFKFTKRLPESCTLLAAEALEALRFSLDQAGYAAAILSGKTDPKWTQFPISDTPDELNNLTHCGPQSLPVRLCCRRVVGVHMANPKSVQETPGNHGGRQ